MIISSVGGFDIETGVIKTWLVQTARPDRTNLNWSSSVKNEVPAWAKVLLVTLNYYQNHRKCHQNHGKRKRQDKRETMELWSLVALLREQNWIRKVFVGFLLWLLRNTQRNPLEICRNSTSILREINEKLLQKFSRNSNKSLGRFLTKKPSGLLLLVFILTSNFWRG